MRSVVLCRLGFTDAYVERIRAEIPEAWHVKETMREVNANSQPPNVVCVLNGGELQQKIQAVRVRFCGGAAAGTFHVSLKKLREFFNALNSPKKILEN